jgi:hypothetical protein
MYSTHSDFELMSLSKNHNSFQTCDYYPRLGSFHEFNSRSIENSSDEKILLEKFQHDISVKLETGEKKNIQHLTTNDFLSSAKQSQQYSR